MKIRSSVITAAILSFALFSGRDARAQSKSSGGYALDRFDPSERGSEWFALDTLDLRGHVRPAAGVVFDWAHRPLALYDKDGNVTKEIVGEQIFLHVGGSVVFWDRLRVAANLPIAIYETGDTGTLASNNTTYPAPGGAGIGDLRLSGDFRFLGTYGDAFTLAGGVSVYFPTGSREKYTGDETLRLQPHVIGAGDIGPFVYSAKLGVNVRPDDRSFGDTKLGTEFNFGGAVGLRVLDKKLVIGPEVYGSTVFARAFDKPATPAEGILGFHYSAGDFRFGAGGGAGLTRGFGSPVARVVATLEWAPRFEKPEEDRDHDGILDKDDACPDTPGVHTDDPKTNGCPPPPPPEGPKDTDGDGIMDPDDACVDVPGVKTDDPKTNGCPSDRDKDGILDKDDACPDVPGVKTQDPKTNGCPPDPDRDKDGIPNEEDACPDEPGKKNPDPKKNGCPQAFIKDGQIRILDQVKFATASAQIVKGKDSEDILNAVLKVLTDHPDITKVRVEGHTDDRGSAKLNTKLSADRAASVVKWLTQHGIAADRLTSAGFGPDRPIESNTTPEGRQANRRVEFHIDSEKPKQ